MNRIFYDLETTGADTSNCKIVEMCFTDHEGNILLHEYVNPGRPIGKQATEVHGIKNSDVMGCLPFADHAPAVQQLITGAVILVGFNNIHFDSVVLDRELTEAGMPGLEKDEHGVVTHPEIDLFAIWKNTEKRNLSTAVKRFTGENLEDAHSASADTTILPAVLHGMSEQLGIVDVGPALLHASVPEGSVDREGKFMRREDGTVVFNFGKHKDKPVTSGEGRKYLSWMQSAGFSPDVKAWCRRFLA